MNQYIITEGELRKVVEVLRDEGCGQYSKILKQQVMSRPYHSIQQELRQSKAGEPG